MRKTPTAGTDERSVCWVGCVGVYACGVGVSRWGWGPRRGAAMPRVAVHRNGGLRLGLLPLSRLSLFFFRLSPLLCPVGGTAVARRAHPAATAPPRQQARCGTSLSHRVEFRDTQRLASIVRKHGNMVLRRSQHERKGEATEPYGLRVWLSGPPRRAYTS